MILIIYAHPDTKGHNNIILEEVLKGLKNQDIELIDLYKIKYDPILHEGEHYTSDHYRISKENKKFQKKIKEADKLILIYPIWWGAMPAILKGFFDRVFTSYFAYKFERGIPKKLLKGKKALIITTSGATNFMSLFFNSCAGKNIQKNILGFCGIKSKRYNIGKAVKENLNLKQKKRIKRVVLKGLKWLD